MKRGLLTKLKYVLVLFFFVVAASAFGQAATITGKVTDSHGTPVIGANVVVVGTTIGTVTDIDGNYTLEIPTTTKEVSFSFIGYLTETVQVNLPSGGSQKIDVTLVEDMMELEDVVVIGYGTQKKSDLTGAVASISSEDVNATTNSTVENALQGRAAGVRISSVTGAPGANVKVFIRGQTSINNSDPLWIVDGVGADPKSINPNDIESIEILKDAATTAIYGSAGGNGVIIVTTKRGKAGKTSANLDVTYGWQKIPESSYIDMASGPEFGQMYTEYQRLMRTREDRIMFTNFDDLPTYNYQKEVFQVAPMQSYSLGVSGGSEKSNFYMGLNYTDQEGVLKNSNYKKFNIRINSDHKLNNWLSVGENVTVTRQVWGGFEEWQLLNEYHTPILGALQYQPFVPVYVDSLGNEAASKNDFTNWSYSPIGNTSNPVSRIDLLNSERESVATKATAFVVIEPLKGLRIESRMTGDVSNGNSYAFIPVFFITPSYNNSVSSIKRAFSDYHGWNWQNFASYSNSLFGAHNFTVLAGYDAGASWGKDMSATRYDLLSEEPEMWYFNAALDDTLDASLPDGGGYEQSGYRYFGRLSYDYKGIVLGQLNFSRDFSSKFGPRERMGTFPSYSVGLKFTEFEAVRNSLPFLNFGKIRYGNGVTGSNTLDNYTFYSNIRVAQVYDYSFDNSGTNSTGGALGAMPNPAIHWEGVRTQNLAFDLAFLQNRLSVTAEWFKRNNEGMIMPVDLPGIAGYRIRDMYQEGGESRPPYNIGKMVNKGYELQLSWKESRGKFSYSASFNYTYVDSKAQNLPDTVFTGTITGVNGYLTRTVPNGPISEYYGLQVERLFMPEDYDETQERITNQPYVDDPETGDRIYAQPDARPGDFKFKDINNDGRIDSKDIGPIGNPIPKHDYALTIDLAYGWFDLNIFLQGAAGFKVFNATKIYSVSADGGWNWSKDYVDNHYREDIYNRAGDVLVFEARHNAKYPRIDPLNANGNFTNISDFYMENGAYLRIKSLQLGMTLPSEWTQKVGVQSLRVYCGAQNLVTFTKYSGYDPEIGFTSMLIQGLDKAGYPRAQMYTLGANIKF